MTVAEKHSAGASLAGFAFQLDRAIQWLAKANLGDQVGIESLDDVVMETAGGQLHLEQDKLSFRRNPVTDLSENLWKTLGIWISLVKNGECDLANCQFYLVTNQPVTTGIAAMLKAPPSQRSQNELTGTVRKIAKKLGAKWQGYASLVLALPVRELTLFLDRIAVVDEAPFAEQHGANIHLGECLSLHSSIIDPVVNGLRGWVLEVVLTHLSASCIPHPTTPPQPAWIDVGTFRANLARLTTKYFDNRLIVRAAKDIVVTNEQTEKTKSETFVRQMELIDFDSDFPEEFIDAIADFLRSNDERTRLAVENGITGKVFESYENSLIDFWKITKRQAKRRGLESENATGQEVLDECLKHQPQLDGQSLSEGYLSRGTFHHLANVPVIGWHPRYGDLL